MSTEPIREDEQKLQDIGRPIGALMRLPLSHRWEFTRRHSLYLNYWEAAKQHRHRPSDDLVAFREGEKAILMLTLIGVSGEPVSPSSSAEELTDDDLGQVWEGGAIAPLTFRGLISLLITAVPPEDRRGVADLIMESARNSELGIHPYYLLQQFNQINNPLLDKLVPAPLLSINLHAPQRAIREAVEAFVQKKKIEQGIPETRRRDESLDDYLRVWDLREGWTGSGYDPTGELTFRRIAQQLCESLATIRSRYRRAFELVTGRDYSAALWLTLFGIDRVRAFGLNVNDLPLRYRSVGTFAGRKSPTPESQILIATDDRVTGLIGGKSLSGGSIETALLLDDIGDMIRKGQTNEEIILATGLSTVDADDLIDWIRGRIDDGTFDSMRSDF